jgi:hypothetical protein
MEDELTLDEIEALTKPTPTPTPTPKPQFKSRYEPPKQFGPLRHFDQEMRCVSRGCRSPTYHKVKGIPYCMIHAMQELNSMVVKLEQTLDSKNRHGSEQDPEA